MSRFVWFYVHVPYCLYNVNVRKHIALPPCWRKSVVFWREGGSELEREKERTGEKAHFPWTIRENFFPPSYFYSWRATIKAPNVQADEFFISLSFWIKKQGSHFRTQSFLCFRLLFFLLFNFFLSFFFSFFLATGS